MGKWMPRRFPLLAKADAIIAPCMLGRRGFQLGAMGLLYYLPLQKSSTVRLCAESMQGPCLQLQHSSAYKLVAVAG